MEKDYTDEDRRIALNFFGGCAFCGAKEAPRHDHLVPVAENGDFIRQNVVPACQKCDDSKGRSDFRKWMQSAKHLRQQGLTSDAIKDRIRRIEQFQFGYRPRTDKELFGAAIDRYKNILSRMGDLCKDAENLIKEAKPQKIAVPRPSGLSSSQLVSASHNGAEDIRLFVVKEYIERARRDGKKSVTIRAGDVYARMGRNGYRNVCQVLRGRLLQEKAKVKKPVEEKGGGVHGTEGANISFTYEL